VNAKLISSLPGRFCAVCKFAPHRPTISWLHQATKTQGTYAALWMRCPRLSDTRVRQSRKNFRSRHVFLMYLFQFVWFEQPKGVVSFKSCHLLLARCEKITLNFSRHGMTQRFRENYLISILYFSFPLIIIWQNSFF